VEREGRGDGREGIEWRERSEGEKRGWGRGGRPWGWAPTFWARTATEDNIVETGV
jgi:hypothetical protein